MESCSQQKLSCLNDLLFNIKELFPLFWVQEFEFEEESLNLLKG